MNSKTKALHKTYDRSTWISKKKGAEIQKSQGKSAHNIKRDEMIRAKLKQARKTGSSGYGF